ncbi:MAG: DUF192 domain-containing protein [Rickettsiales endosymbiont of Dermacentor nuttalli]
MFILIGCGKVVEFDKGILTLIRNNIKLYEFTLEIAETKVQRDLGLMHRKEILDSHAMIFIFPVEQRVSMWMKNTFIPLDMLFINSKGVIMEIIENTTPMSKRSILSKDPVSMVVEVKAGTVKKLNINKEDTISWYKL